MDLLKQSHIFRKTPCMSTRASSKFAGGGSGDGVKGQGRQGRKHTRLQISGRLSEEVVALCCHSYRRTVVLVTVTRQARLVLNGVRGVNIRCGR